MSPFNRVRSVPCKTSPNCSPFPADESFSLAFLVGLDAVPSGHCCRLPAARQRVRSRVTVYVPTGWPSSSRVNRFSIVPSKPASAPIPSFTVPGLHCLGAAEGRFGNRRREDERAAADVLQ